MFQGRKKKPYRLNPAVRLQLAFRWLTIWIAGPIIVVLGAWWWWSLP